MTTIYVHSRSFYNGAQGSLCPLLSIHHIISEDWYLNPLFSVINFKAHWFLAWIRGHDTILWMVC